MKNNKGFLLAESLVVSTFVLTVLIFLFVQYQNLMTTYKNNSDYNNPEAIYNLGSAGQFLSANTTRLMSLNDNLGSNTYIKVYDKSSGGCNASLGLETFCNTIFNSIGAKKVIYTNSNLDSIKNYIKSNSDSYLNQALRDFIKRLDADEIDGKGRLIAEFDNGYFATIALNVATPHEEAISPCSIGGNYVSTVTSGDGLYADEYESGKCVYKGTNPNNYIKFNNKLWKIISRESDGTYKIISIDYIEGVPFDEETGGIDWAAPAGLNTYLNSNFYNTLSDKAKNLIVSHDFRIGGIDYDTAYDGDVSKILEKEKSKIWKGKIGLCTLSDFYDSFNTKEISYGITSWLSTIEGDESYIWKWTMNPLLDEYGTSVWTFSDYDICDHGTNDGYSYAWFTHPVVYINSNITLSGSGTKDDPFVINN